MMRVVVACDDKCSRQATAISNSGGLEWGELGNGTFWIDDSMELPEGWAFVVVNDEMQARCPEHAK